MKKNVIALAVAAAMAAPLAAQAEVSISGGLQAELSSVGGDGVSMLKGLYARDGGEYGSENGGNYGFLKFSASEDLGGGMKALAMWNANINVGDTNAAGLATRDSYVGLTGGFGTVLAGTLATPYKSSTVKWDPFLATSLQARGSGGMSTLQNGYASNALAYANKFGPATVVIALVLDEGAEVPASDKTNAEHAKSISVNAPVGPVEVAFAYVDASKFSDLGNLGLGSAVAGVSLDTVTATKIGVKWASGPITVAGQHEMIELGNATTAKDTCTYVTASYAMGANTFSVGLGQYDPDATGVDSTKYTAVGVKHAFSKSTSLTAGFRSTDADGAADESVVSAGLRVGF